MKQKQKHSNESFKQGYQSRINWWLMLVMSRFSSNQVASIFPRSAFLKAICLAYHPNDLNLNLLQQGPYSILILGAVCG